MVEFVDGTILAQMSSPDMRFPIQYALTYPDKFPGALEPLDFAKFAELSFALPDHSIFPSIEFAHEALRQGGTLPTVMNAANEVAVLRFRDGKIHFKEIWNIIEQTMNAHKNILSPDIPAIMDADKEARIFAEQLCKA